MIRCPSEVFDTDTQRTKRLFGKHIHEVKPYESNSMNTSGFHIRSLRSTNGIIKVYMYNMYICIYILNIQM